MGFAELGGYLQQTLALIGLLALGIHFIRPFLPHSGHDRNGTHEPSALGADEDADAGAIVRIFDDKKPDPPDSAPVEPETRKTFQRDDYTIGLVTALDREFRAAIATLDERHAEPSDFSARPDDINHYVWGRVAKHNVVVVTFPLGRVGTSVASHVATQMVSAVPSIRFGLMVGIGGGVPWVGGKHTDVRLGDVVVSAPSGAGTTAGVVQYDLGKEETGGTTRRCGSLNGPPQALLSAVSYFKAETEMAALAGAIRQAAARIRTKFRVGTYAYQGVEEDTLFKAWYSGSGPSWWIFGFLPFRFLRDFAIVKRERREEPAVPRIHYGLIASGNKVIKNARTRDELTSWLKQNTSGGECLCFEMVAAGIMDNFPCLVIRGISDYADSHRNDKWQDYAALAAAAYAKKLLEYNSSKEASGVIGVTREVRQDVQDVKAGIHLMSEGELDKKIEHWLRLSHRTIYLSQAKEARKHHDETNTWIFEHEAYIGWLSRNPNHLWLYGLSACGKTVLSSTIIHKLGEESCPYFFIDFRKEYTFVDALSSLVCHLYSLPQEPKELLRWLHGRTVHAQTENNKFCIIMTSRSDQQDITKWLDSSNLSLEELPLDQATAGVKADIVRYIQTRLTGDRTFDRWRSDRTQSGNKPILEVIEEKLTAEAGTM
ncbi:hypothetical protein SLS58_009236 [Diplodia intermedia]|uniref:Nephrocystin 3-like N-terminal domain-containing protein n=1 Tax=Diplodia intermedia TaxID=856260 RepID=A0ABR3TDJ3_9PEZI